MTMITLNSEDFMLRKEECQAAMDQWSLHLAHFPELKQLLPTNYIFEINTGHLDWMRKNSKYEEFCAAMGVYDAQVILILYPMDEKGYRKDMDEYPCTLLSPLQYDLRLQEIQQYTVVKNALLSKDLQDIDKNADMSFPISNKPVLEQDKALEAIEKWRNEGMEWFYQECTDYKGARIFTKFYVPTADLCLENVGLKRIVCSFGLKYNDIYGRMLVTLIFISFLENLENTGSSALTEANTYDWAKPCPPVCRIPMDGF
ncbi:hypothetical protein EGY07_02610 [Chryseobacterium indologenes]|nr:hypothetical protein EGY07_02610 [Chryseobacterium indologenes]MBF6643099.1 hypothetical protein [Chryseobacterium indologenes]MBU3049640.1 hypothetical protein [Chryseobacterium indologenes]QQQ73007.1 hypothetical protein JHW31_09860 [Chryseobacterium indologenes]